MVSILNLDEFAALMAMAGVKLIKGTQCQFGAASSKPTAWVAFIVDLTDMPSSCDHVKRQWFNQGNGAVVMQSHMPTTGKTKFALLPPPRQRVAVRTFKPTEWVATSVAAYPDLLNRFLVARITSTLYRKPLPSVTLQSVPPQGDQDGLIGTPSGPKLGYSNGFREKIFGWTHCVVSFLRPIRKRPTPSPSVDSAMQRPPSKSRPFS